MKRNKFLTGVAAFATMLLFSFSQINQAFTRNDQGFKINTGEGRIHGHIQLKGVNKNILDVKISGSDTDGALAVFELTSLSQGKGTPLHIHPEQGRK